MSSIVGGLDILRQWRFSAVLEHHAAAVRMTLNPAWKVDFIDPEEAQLPLHQAAEARRQASSTVTFNLNNKNNNNEKDNNTNNAGANQNNNNNNNTNTPGTKNGMPKMFLVPFLAFTDETMAPRKGATDLLSGFSVGWGTTIKKVKFFYANLPPPLHLPAVGSADPEELELSRMKAWCKRCVQHVLDDNRVVSIDCEKKLRKLRTKSMLSREQRISLGGRHNGFRFNIAYEQKGEMSPQSNAIALCVCSKDRGYMVLIECVSQTELEGYTTNVLVKTWLSDSKRFELDADINNYSECSHAALQLQQSLFGELVFTDNDAAIAFRLPMHPMTLRPDHSPTVPPATGSLCCVTLDLVIHQKLLDALEEDEAMAVGGKMRLINVVLFVEIEDLLKEPNFPTVFSGDSYSQRRHQAFTEVFRDSRVIGLPLSVPIGKRTGRSTTCTFSTVMNDTQALVKATTVTTLVGSHGAAATYFTKLGQGMFDQYLYLYQHLLKTLTFFAERDISGTFSRYRSVPVRILEPDLAACYPHHNGVDPSARLVALQKHITALRASSDGEVDGVGTTQMADVIRIDENMTNPATGSASAKLSSSSSQQNQNNKKQQGNTSVVEDEGVVVIVSEDGTTTTTTTTDNNDNIKRKKNADGSPLHEASDASNNSEDHQQVGNNNNNINNNNQYYYGYSSRRFTDNDSVISITDIPRLASEELALLEEEEEQRLLKEKMLLAGEFVDSNLISGSPGNNNNRARSPGMMAGEDEELNTNNNNLGGGGESSAGHLLDVNTNTKIGGGGGGADSVREGNSEIQIESRLSSYNKQQGGGGAAGGGGGGSHNAHDRDATASIGVAIDEEDENASIVPSIVDSNTNRANDQESSRMATAGGSQIAGAGVDTASMDPDRYQQRGQPTQQQLQDLSEALALIGGDHHHQKNSRSGNQGTKNDVEDEIEAAMNSTGGGQKQQTNQQQTGGTSSLRNSYAELCKEAGCRPNSYLLQKLPVLPRIAQTIEALDMSHNYVGHSGFIAILRLLDLLPRLHSVYFNSMSLDNQDVISLCDTLAEHTTIHSVFLKNNPRITLPAAKSFFRLLKDNINIHTICLTGTGIGIALQQRIEKEATLNKEIQTQNEKMRKQQQQAAVAGTNVNNNVNNDNDGPSSPLKMTTLTVGAPGSQPHLDEEYNNQQQQQRVQNSASSPSVASGTTNNSSPKPQNQTEEL